MKHGDISNKQGYVIAFRVENSLVKPKEGFFGFMNKLLHGKIRGGEINQKAYGMLNYIYKHTDMTILLVMNKSAYGSKEFSFFADFPYNEFLLVDDISEITMKLITGEISYYVSEDMEDRLSVNHQYSIGLEELYTLVKKGR